MEHFSIVPGHNPEVPVANPGSTRFSGNQLNLTSRNEELLE
jgi:hypothetical protein